MIQKGDKIIPIEVKAEENLKAKSLSAFVARYPSLHGARLSMSDYREQEWMVNVPLYAARKPPINRLTAEQRSDFLSISQAGERRR
ncbi:MAG: hypothetical protein PUC77_08045 [Bacteroidales bacterium]|nr:hypothetical protein [Bacteroidales bacterium]MDD6621419.1 hypothetical protein [Bacteroidales bacterium]